MHLATVRDVVQIGVPHAQRFAAGHALRVAQPVIRIVIEEDAGRILELRDHAAPLRATGRALLAGGEGGLDPRFLDAPRVQSDEQQRAGEGGAQQEKTLGFIHGTSTTDYTECTDGGK